MHKKFDNAAIEKKWQTKWEQTGIYKTDIQSTKPKSYVLDMFPYPSGEGLHVGHPKGYIATDIYSRFKKMNSFEVLHPMGWDAFGLPAENFAIKHKIHPRVAVETNISNFKTQLAELGCNYDWSKEINTTDNEFVKWTQWIFLRMFEKGLAYESYEPINWCPSCQTGLANEDLESDGTCERCGSIVEKKPMRQWVLKITEYADRMLADLDTLQWPEHIKEAQRNWIGRSEGAEIDFAISTGDTVTIFTTRPDTLFGATFLVLAPEHSLVTKIKTNCSNIEEINAYITLATATDENDRLDTTKEKTGIKLEGITATNPANGERVPVFIADYVLGGYGTGALMAVPAHDERDFEFAQKFDLSVTNVIEPLFRETRGDSTYRPDQPIVERNAITALVRNPKNNTFLALKFKNHDWEAFVTGGIEQGQTAEEAARQEVLEETGYKNLKLIKQLPNCHALLWHVSKNENRLAHFNCFLFDLIDEERVEVVEEERVKHETVWLTEIELETFKLPDGARHTLRIVLEKASLFTGNGLLTSSGEFTGMDSEEAKKKIVEKVGGKITSTYRLKNWVFSRQRYWGEPIPVVHCEKCGVVAVPDSELPISLPAVENYAPTGTGESPLADIENWVNTTCPKCGGHAKRETNTMPQWAGSSWYYLRFADPHNSNTLIDSEIEKKWLPVDVYVGGDHAVRHLIYARFWHKFLYDIGVVHTLEPFTRLEFLGFILAEDGRKMSKRWGNIINPSDIVKTNGADALRIYEMFMGPFENTIAWSKDGIVGSQRFLERVNGLHEHLVESETTTVTRLLHKTIAKVRSDIEAFKFNTAISALMIFLNSAEKQGISRKSYELFIALLSPFAPHLTEELWETLGYTHSIHLQAFPVSDALLVEDSEVTIGIQVQGKMRGSITIASEAEEVVVRAAAETHPVVRKYLVREIDTVIYVPKKIINFILKE